MPTPPSTLAERAGSRHFARGDRPRGEQRRPMGEEIKSASFAAADFARFEQRLRQETATAREMFDNNAFSESGYSLGFEIEAWLLDHAFFPNPVNEAFLEAINDPLVVPELSRFNVELNCTPAVICLLYTSPSPRDS